MLLRLKTFASSSCLLGRHTTRNLSMQKLSFPTNVLNASLRIKFLTLQRRCLTQQFTKTTSRRSVLKSPGVGVSVVAIGGTVLARFLLRRCLHRTECQAKSFSRVPFQPENSSGAEPAFKWRRFLALILPIKWLLGAAVAVSVSAAACAPQYSSICYVMCIISGVVVYKNM